MKNCNAFDFHTNKYLKLARDNSGEGGPLKWCAFAHFAHS